MIESKSFGSKAFKVMIILFLSPSVGVINHVQA